MMGVISWIVTGLIVGLIARALVPGRQSLGLLLTVALGVVGAFVGGMLSSALFGPPPADVADAARMWPGWIMSIVGAVVVLAAMVALTGDRRATETI